MLPIPQVRTVGGPAKPARQLAQLEHSPLFPPFYCRAYSSYRGEKHNSNSLQGRGIDCGCGEAGGGGELGRGEDGGEGRW